MGGLSVPLGISSSAAIERYDSYRNVWERCAVDLPEEVSRCTALVCGEMVHIMGGARHSSKGGEGKLDNHWIIDLKEILP